MRVFVVGHQKKVDHFSFHKAHKKRCFKAILAWCFATKKLGLNKPIYVACQNRICKAGRQAGKRPKNLLGVRRQLEKKRSRTD
jgi:hypothetical protein